MLRFTGTLPAVDYYLLPAQSGPGHTPQSGKEKKVSWICSSCLLTLLAALPAMPVLPSEYMINPGESRIELTVFKAGVLKLFGHDHQIAARQFAGNVQMMEGRIVESSLTLSIEAGSLTVLDPDSPETERGKVQDTMLGAQVLDVRTYPTISFSSTSVRSVKESNNDWEVIVAGMLNLHGVEKAISIPVRVHPENGRLRAQGEVSISQSDFGITPIAVAGGTIRVKNEVRVRFSIVASRPPRLTGRGEVHFLQQPFESRVVPQGIPDRIYAQEVNTPTARIVCPVQPFECGVLVTQAEM
jgi:polyisoprenoid-binding protein YceI